MAIVSEISTKRVAAVHVVGLREEIDSFGDQGRLWKTLTAFVETHGLTGTGPGFAVHYNLGEVVGKPGKIDVEVCIPVPHDTSVPSDHGIQGLSVHTLPAIEQAAFVTLEGSCIALPDAYTALFGWLTAQNKTICGATREIYLTHEADPMSESYKCEIQAPI